jgi:putative NIF3 family GTP cyclohydrolase 1 type 2
MHPSKDRTNVKTVLHLEELTEFLDQVFDAARFEDDLHGLYRHSTRPIQRIGLLLEPKPDLIEWVVKQQIDALFLHRPWKLQLEQLPPDIGVIAYHLAFDECLTLGFNARLAIALGISSLEVLGEKAGRPIGMLGEVLPQSFAHYCHQVKAVFGGQDEVYIGKESVSRVAVVGAMTEPLVREAAARNADLYLTGQFRKPAEAALQETGLAAIIVGHQRAEAWGLRALTHLLQERWATLEIVLANREKCRVTNTGGE